MIRVPNSARMRVLVVDDQVDCVVSIGRLLEAFGYRVRLALDGPGAVACAAEFRPQAALLDLSIPHLDGFGVAERLRAMPETRDMYLIAMTGWGTDEVRARIQAGGFDQYLVKPLSADMLSSTLGAVARERNVTPNAPRQPERSDTRSPERSDTRSHPERSATQSHPERSEGSAFPEFRRRSWRAT